jgi:predicted GIY-YIG superfamily endonuclease
VGSDGDFEGVDRPSVRGACFLVGFLYTYSRHYVYGLVDPRDGGIFYVGVTAVPLERLTAHGQVYSPAYERVRAIKQAGFVPEMRTLAVFGDRSEAYDYELYLIRRMPGLVNVAGRHGGIYADSDFKLPVAAKRAELEYVDIETFDLESSVLEDECDQGEYDMYMKAYGLRKRQEKAE